MTLLSVVAKNAARNRLRTAMTVVGVAVTLIAFVLLRTVIVAWNAGGEHAAKDRLSTRNKASFGLPLPKRTFDGLAERVPGIVSATYCDWFGGTWTRDPSQFFASVACADNAFSVYPEIHVDPVALARWRADKHGAIIGDLLAKKLGLKVGDDATLEGTFFPGTWELTVAGIYTVPPESAMDRSSFFLRWDYKNDGVTEREKDRIGWIFTRVDDAARAPEVARAIDALFDDTDVRTLTMSERAANTELLGSIRAVIRTLDIASLAALAILTLILTNTLAMNARERTAEYAVLRVLGFTPAHVGGLVVAEALLVTTVATLLGLGVAVPLVNRGVGAFLEENMGKFFPVFRVTPETLLATLVATFTLAALAAVVPAIRSARLAPFEAIRRAH